MPAPQVARSPFSAGEERGAEPTRLMRPGHEQKTQVRGPIQSASWDEPRESDNVVALKRRQNDIACMQGLREVRSCASRGEYPACLEMLARGDLTATPLVSAFVPLAEGPAWFDRLCRKEPGLLKVVLKP